MKYLIILLCFLTSSLALKAQFVTDHFTDGEWYFGFKAGLNYTTTEHLKSTLIADFYPEETYQVEVPYTLGYVGGIFLYHRFRNGSQQKGNLAIQPEITYAIQETDFLYSDINDLSYEMQFKYHYFQLLPLLKVYPFWNFHIALGPQLGFNVEKNNINYISNMPELGPDLQIRENLREVLKGETDFSMVFGLGYEFKFGMNIEARYKLGLSDVIETQANGYNFREQNNRMTSFQLTLGYVIPFNQE